MLHSFNKSFFANCRTYRIFVGYLFSKLMTSDGSSAPVVWNKNLDSLLIAVYVRYRPSSVYFPYSFERVKSFFFTNFTTNLLKYDESIEAVCFSVLKPTSGQVYNTKIIHAIINHCCNLTLPLSLFTFYVLCFAERRLEGYPEQVAFMFPFYFQQMFCVFWSKCSLGFSNNKCSGFPPQSIYMLLMFLIKKL
jgi:hypothetical protein